MGKKNNNTPSGTRKKSSVSKPLKVKDKGKVVTKNLKQLNLKNRVKIVENDKTFSNVQETLLRQGKPKAKSPEKKPPKRKKHQSKSEKMDVSELNNAIESWIVCGNPWVEGNSK